MGFFSIGGFFDPGGHPVWRGRNVAPKQTARLIGGLFCWNETATYLPGLKVTPGAGFRTGLPPGGNAASSAVARWDHGPAASMRLT